MATYFGGVPPSPRDEQAGVDKDGSGFLVANPTVKTINFEETSVTHHTSSMMQSRKASQRGGARRRSSAYSEYAVTEYYGHERNEREDDSKSRASSAAVAPQQQRAAVKASPSMIAEQRRRKKMCILIIVLILLALVLLAIFILALIMFLARLEGKVPSKYWTGDSGYLLDGMDPVSYRYIPKDHAPKVGTVDSSADSTTEYDGVKISFWGVLNLKTFEEAESPSYYMPRFGGWPVETLGQWRVASPNVDLWTVLNDELYLHASEEGKEQFREDPSKYLKEANYIYSFWGY